MPELSFSNSDAACFQIGSPSRASKSQLRLRVRVLSSYKDSSTSNGKDKAITRYVLKVTDTLAHTSWQIDHRYSDFLRLRQKLSAFLKSSGSRTSIPKITGMYSLRPLIGSSAYEQRLSEERIVQLQEFISAILEQFGDDNIIVNAFLGNDQSGLLRGGISTEESPFKPSPVKDPQRHSKPNKSINIVTFSVTLITIFIIVIKFVFFEIYHCLSNRFILCYIV